MSAIATSPEWVVTPHGPGVHDATDGITYLRYDTFKGFTSGASEASAFMFLNLNDSPVDNGFMALSGGSADFLWWHVNVPKMSIRLGNVGYVASQGSFPLTSPWHTIVFSFYNGGVDHVSGHCYCI